MKHKKQKHLIPNKYATYKKTIYLLTNKEPKLRSITQIPHKGSTKAQGKLTVKKFKRITFTI